MCFHEITTPGNYLDRKKTDSTNSFKIRYEIKSPRAFHSLIYDNSLTDKRCSR